MTSSGGFVPGHLPAAAIHDLIRMCKPDGFIVVVMRYEYLTICDEFREMESLMTQLEHENPGGWRQVERRLSPNYLLDKEGIVFVYRKISPSTS